MFLYMTSTRYFLNVIIQNKTVIIDIFFLSTTNYFLMKKTHFLQVTFMILKGRLIVMTIVHSVERMRII